MARKEKRDEGLVTVSLELTKRARDAIRDLKVTKGRSQKYTVEQILIWFGDEPEDVQEEIIEHGNPAAAIVKHGLAADWVPATIPDAAKAIRGLLAVIDNVHAAHRNQLAKMQQQAQRD